MGAHCGVSTYEFSQLVGANGRVVSFEPDPTSFALLQRNIERHGLTNVMALNVALAGTRGVAKFSAEGTLGSTLTRHLPRETVGSIVSVQTITLADAFEGYGVPTFCKMDIEGAEVEVLAAGREAIKAHRIQFTLDTNHTVNGRLTDKPVEKIFRGCGYPDGNS